MPLYEFKCNKCNKEFEAISKIDDRLNVKCSCGGSTTIQIVGSKPQIFQPFFHEDFDEKPVLVRSKKHYKELCKQYGVYAPHEFGVGWNISEI